MWQRIVARPVHGEHLTLALVELEAGAIVAEHSHDNEQLGLVLRGLMHFHIGEEERELGQGGTWCVPSGTPHEATADPDGASAIDVFAPVPVATRAEIEPQQPSPGRWP